MEHRNVLRRRGRGAIVPFSIIYGVLFSVGAHVAVSASNGSTSIVLLLYVPLAALEGILIGLIAGILAYISGSSTVNTQIPQGVRYLGQALAAGTVSALAYNLVWNGFWRPGPPLLLVVLSGFVVLLGTFAYLWRFELPSRERD